MAEKLNNQQKGEMARYVIVPAILGILGLSSCGIGYIQENNLKENNLVYREYRDNSSSLQQLRKELKNFVMLDSKKASVLEREVKMAKEDSIRIINIPEIKECLQKQEGINEYNKWGILGVGLCYIMSVIGGGRILSSRLK